jgi:hypothetical protein
LDRAPTLGGEFAWFHAVAIVRQLVDQLIPGVDEAPAGSIPALNGLSLDANGVLRAKADPRNPVPPVVALGALLHDLLSGRDQPGALRLLTVQASAAAPTITLTELVYQLGQWERPNRKELLNAVYAMLGNIPAPRPVVAASPSPGVSPAEKEMAAQRTASRGGPRLSRRVVAGAVIGGGLIVVAALLLFVSRGGVFASRGGASGSAPAFSSETVPSVDAASVPARGSAALDRTIGSSSSGPQGRAPALAPRASADNRLALPERAIVSPRPSGPATSRQTARMTNAENEFRRAQALLGNHRYAEAAAGFDRVLRMTDDNTAGASQLRWMANEFRTLGQGLAEQDAAVAARVYTAADTNVVPPVPLGLFLPPPPSDPGDRRCAVQIVIDATGAVESAKLVGSRIASRDYWWVAVAKAWRFQPATRDGRPVRFLASIPIPDEGLPP